MVVLWHSGRQTHVIDFVPSHLCAVMYAFSPVTESCAEMETLSTTVQESLNESQQICTALLRKTAL